MNTPLVIFPITLFFVALLALFSGIGVVMLQQHRRGGIFTTFMWTIFSGSISMGFALFGVFVYITQNNAPLAIGIGVIGILLVLLSGWIATR